MILKTADELWAKHGNGAYSFKYVRLTGDRFRFATLGFFAPSHQQLAGDDKVVSAGFVSIERDRVIKVRDGFSMTLKLGPMEGDQELIERFLAGNPA